MPVASGQPVRWGGEADFNGRYVWRGFTYSEGPVFQPAVWLEAKRVTFSVWSNMPLSREPRQGRFDQLFWTATTWRQMRRWRVEGTLQGYVWQGPPGIPTTRTAEVSGRVSYTAGPVTLFTLHTTDIAAYRGAYFIESGVGWERQSRRVKWEAHAIVGAWNGRFNRAYVDVARGAVDFAQLDLAASIPLKGGWYLRPHAELTQITSQVIRQAVTNRRVLNAGVALGWTF